ncbi:hypothetical protein [Arenimonas soli]|nr:hypothetical protein [Arenimonas soli]
MDATITSPMGAPRDTAETYYFHDKRDGEMALNMFIRQDSLVYHYYRRTNEEPEDVERRVAELKKLFAGHADGCEIR